MQTPVKAQSKTTDLIKSLQEKAQTVNKFESDTEDARFDSMEEEEEEKLESDEDEDIALLATNEPRHVVVDVNAVERVQHEQEEDDDDIDESSTNEVMSRESEDSGDDQDNFQDMLN